LHNLSLTIIVSIQNGYNAYWTGTSTLGSEQYVAVTRGGTGTGTFTSNGVLYGNGTGAIQATAAGTSAQFLVANGSGVPTFVSMSSDVLISNAGVATIQANSVALTTDTTGNYVATVSTSALTGITGGAAGSEGTAITLGFDYSATLAANPALATGNAVFGTTGLIFEGATADTFEGLLTVPTRLVLVDHNELTQAVPGADEVTITEIIDHHRLGPMATPQPILFLNEPVGSTCTIVADLFRRHGLKPHAEVLEEAGVLGGDHSSL